MPSIFYQSDILVIPGTVRPPTGVGEDPVEPRPRPCRVTVDLLQVSYDGGNVGSDWRFRIYVNGEPWDSGPCQIHPGETEHFSQQIANYRTDGGCLFPQIVQLHLHAVERDLGPDDRASRLVLGAPICLEEPRPDMLIVPLYVEERLSWFERLFGKRQSVAHLVFWFRLQAVCEDP